jgi:hypothetical protein
MLLVMMPSQERTCLFWNALHLLVRNLSAIVLHVMEGGYLHRVGDINAALFLAAVYIESAMVWQAGCGPS